MKFEEKLSKIEEIATLLQNKETELEKSVELYEEGMKLAKELEEELGKFERRIDIATKDLEDGVETEPYNIPN